ncbi:hypothetical protein V1294_006326 [Bradyrhizobium sp. AZCC 1678]|uniref:hypothetical protein n=1 Tax=Bradyrhizobium sp. AZCC 1678 TaxID=3117030 RepID=UPI002FF20535
MLAKMLPGTPQRAKVAVDNYRLVDMIRVALFREVLMTAKCRNLRPLFLSCLFFLNVFDVLAAEPDEPIAYIGHGAFFDHQGRQIKVTQDFIANAQEFYRKKLASSMPAERAASIAESEKALTQVPASSRQNQLLLTNRFLVSLVPYSKDPAAGRIGSFLNALDQSLKTEVPEGTDVRTPTRRFVPDVQVRDLLQKQMSLNAPFSLPRLGQPLVSTQKSGQQYIDECRSNGVPIPPPVGKMDAAGTDGWKSLGFIPKETQFIVGTPAELRVYASPAGMCFALPRYADDSKQTVALDGVICLGQTTSKVCIWDNQMPVTDGTGVTGGVGFEFAAGEQIPIGVPDLKIDPKGRYQGGGFDLNNGTGGVCTTCHAGENPFIIHPKADLGAGVLMGKLNRPPFNFPTFAANRYDPFVPPAWPQNAESETSNRVPSACSSCHEKDGPAGRFPQLSSSTAEYCGVILRQAVEKTMPPSSPGSLKDDAEIKKFLDLCQIPPNPAMADASP